jgi:hypothetical protein
VDLREMSPAIRHGIEQFLDGRRAGIVHAFAGRVQYLDYAVSAD